MNRDNYVTILAIYDDPPQPPQSQTISSSSSSPTIISVDKTKSHKRNIDAEGVVEITNLNEPPSHGLKVVSENTGNYSGRISPPFSSSAAHHRSEQSSSTTASFRRSPASDNSQKASSSFHKNPNNSSGSSRYKETDMAQLTRDQARKSRFTDAFLDARDRLDEHNEAEESFQNISGNGDPNLRQMKVSLAAETINIPLGIEISAVPDLNDTRKTRILAVEVRHIDEDGRVAIDGRIKVGDQITDINQRPVYQMSFPAAQARLHELQLVDEPILIVTRRTGDDVSNVSSKSLKTTALQQANSTKTGEVISVSIKKASTGFGFGLKSRVNTRDETLICINSVSINGPAYNKLQIGDRLLKINDTEVTTFSQAEVVATLKKVPIGSKVSFCISRITNDQNQSESDSQKPSTSAVNKSPESLEMVHKRRQSAFVDIMDENVEFLTFDVHLINSRSAGLGISLKGGKLYPENGRLESGIDCGLFVKGILHGSAAFHDSRFHENDRLIGIENLDLREYTHNADALAAFSNTLGNVPLSQKSVRIHIARCKDHSSVDFGRKVSTHNKTNPSSFKATSAYADGYDSEVSVAPESDPFNRENPIRKSINEKHPFGGGKDAVHTQAYQKIIHQRQTSAPQFPSDASAFIGNYGLSSEFKKRRSSLTHPRLPLSVAPKLVDLELSPNENKAPNDAYWNALQKLKIANKRQSMFIESTEKPLQVQSLKSMKAHSSSKLAPLSQLFQHFKGGSKKDKSRRHTIYLGSHNDDVVIEPIETTAPDKSKVENQDDGLKPRSLSHEPLSSKTQKSKEEEMIHEVIAGTKSGTLQPANVLRRKKVEPAPSFKMAMSNSQPAFGSTVTDSSGNNTMTDFEAQMIKDKNKRKSTAGGFFRFLQRGNDTHKYAENEGAPPRMPPPYNPSLHQIPPPLPPHGSQAYRYPRTIPGSISHNRMHSAQESTSNHDMFWVSNSSTLPSKIHNNYYDSSNIGISMNPKLSSITKSTVMMDPTKPQSMNRARLTSSNTPTTWPVELQTHITSFTRPRLTSVHLPINNSNNSASINASSYNNNNVKERYNKIISPHFIEETTGIMSWEQQHRMPQTTTTVTIMTPSTPGSPKPRDHWEGDISPHKGNNLPLWLATSTTTKPRRIPSPPPLMPRNCSAPAIPHRNTTNYLRSSQRITTSSMPLHRVPSPSSPLHIQTPTTPPMPVAVHTGFELPQRMNPKTNQRMSLRFRKQKSEPGPSEPISKTPPPENKKFTFGFVRSSKTSFQDEEASERRSRRSVRAPKTASAIFYDTDETPVKC